MKYEVLVADQNSDVQQIVLPVCRMGRWCASEIEAAEMLKRLLEKGWSGSMRSISGGWHVDVVRELRAEHCQIQHTYKQGESI
ncbi:MAG: hypothetical protein IT366_11505 [Candidatus Hydrogenedentes bacterium]|nr:hypothetical protein [Candidatus Hydrogenedentota bacterium]